MMSLFDLNMLFALSRCIALPVIAKTNMYAGFEETDEAMAGRRMLLHLPVLTDYSYCQRYNSATMSIQTLVYLVIFVSPYHLIIVHNMVNKITILRH